MPHREHSTSMQTPVISLTIFNRLGGMQLLITVGGDRWGTGIGTA
jgi:hypothetical protein